MPDKSAWKKEKPKRGIHKMERLVSLRGKGHSRMKRRKEYLTTAIEERSRRTEQLIRSESQTTTLVKKKIVKRLETTT